MQCNPQKPLAFRQYNTVFPLFEGNSYKTGIIVVIFLNYLLFLEHLPYSLSLIELKCSVYVRFLFRQACRFFFNSCICSILYEKSGYLFSFFPM